MKKMQKISIIGIFVILFSVNTINALGFFPTTSISDPVDDIRMIDSDYYESFELRLGDPNRRIDDLNTLYEGMRDNWYDEKITSTLTKSEKSTYAAYDVKEVRFTDVDKEVAKVKLYLNGDFDDAFGWAFLIWNEIADTGDQMLLMLGYIHGIDVYYIIDIEGDTATDMKYNNDEQSVEGEFNAKSFNSENLRFLSVGAYNTSGDTNLIVDIYPNAINWTMIFVTLIVLLIMIVMLIAIVVMYKRY